MLIASLIVAGLPLQADTDASAPPKSVKARVAEAQAKKNVTDELQDLASLSATLSLAQIPEALKIASNLGTMRERIVLQYSVLGRWAELDPQAAFDAIAVLPEGRQRAQTLQLAADRYAKKDAPAAAAAVLALPAGKSRQGASDAVAAAWAKTDGTKALAWAKALPDGLRDSALYALRFSWVHVDPVAASVDVATLPPGNTKNALTANIAEEWTARDSKAAVKWAQSLPDGPEKEIALSNIARTMADKDPKAAISFALGLTPPTLRQNAVVAVVTNWTTQDPKATGDWLVAQAADPDIQKSGLQALMNFWAVIAPAEAAAWLKGIKSEPVLADALQYYVQAATPWAPDISVKLIVELAPEAAGQQAAVQCAQQWVSLDPATARAWINTTKLPDAVKQQWLTPAPPATPQ